MYRKLNPNQSLHSMQRSVRNCGFTIVELMIAVLLGMILTAVVSAIYIGNRQTTVTQRDLANVVQNGSFAIDVVSRLFRQAGQVAVDGLAVGTDAGGAPPNFCGSATAAPAAASASGTSSGGFIEGIDSDTPNGTVIAGSDTVLLRYYGSSAQKAGAAADGSIVDCFGKAIAGPISGSGPAGRTWAKLFVETDSTTGNPALYCEYLNSGDASSTKQALVDNVESFQVMYGVGAKYDAAGTTELAAGTVGNFRIQVKKYLRAGSTSNSDMTVADWNNVIAVRIGMMISGDAPNSRGALDTKTDYNLFGTGYASTNGAGFDATSASSLAASRRSRLRQVFSTTIELKNAPLYVGCASS